MMGFEMAYIPAGTYYVATARQVISEEHRGKLTEITDDNKIFIQATIDEKKETVKTSSNTTATINFPFDSFIPLKPDEVKQNLKKYEGMNVSITGFASVEGSNTYNKKLSKKRADKIASIAKKLGVTVESIKAVGETQCRANGKRELPKCRKVEVSTIIDDGQKP